MDDLIIKCICFKEHSPNAYRELGVVYSLLGGNNDKAIVALKRYLELVESSAVHFEVAMLLAKEGKHVDACIHFTSAIE